MLHKALDCVVDFVTGVTSIILLRFTTYELISIQHFRQVRRMLCRSPCISTMNTSRLS